MTPSGTDVPRSRYGRWPRSRYSSAIPSKEARRAVTSARRSSRGVSLRSWTTRTSLARSRVRSALPVSSGWAPPGRTTITAASPAARAAAADARARFDWLKLPPAISTSDSAAIASPDEELELPDLVAAEAQPREVVTLDEGVPGCRRAPSKLAGVLQRRRSRREPGSREACQRRGESVRGHGFGPPSPTRAGRTGGVGRLLSWLILCHLS